MIPQGAEWMNIFQANIQAEQGGLFSMTQATIVAGHVTEEAEQHLRTHGARIERMAALTIIEVPAGAEVAKGYYTDQYTVAWSTQGEDEEGVYTQDPDEWVVVDLALDATETRVRLEKARVRA